MRNICLSVLLLSTASTYSHAYSFEFSADLDRGLQEATPSDQDLLGRGFAFDIYFQDITLEKGPLAEAAYLARPNMFSMAKQKDRNDDIDEQSKYRTFKYQHVINHKWQLQGSVLKYDVVRVEQDGYSIGGGMYLWKDSLFTIDFSRLDDDSPLKKKIVEWDLNWKSLFALGEDDWLAVEAGYSLYDEEGDDTVSSSAAVTWYPNNRWGFNFDFAFNDKEDADEFVAELGVNSFVGDQLQLFLNWEHTYTEHDIVEDFDTDLLNMGFNLRF